MIVCQCNAVSDRTIQRSIDAGASTVGEVTRQCGAGLYCAPCRAEIRAMIQGAKVCSNQTCGAAPEIQGSVAA